MQGRLEYAFCGIFQDIAHQNLKWISSSTHLPDESFTKA